VTEESRRRRRERFGKRVRENKEASCPYCGAILEAPHPIGQTRITGFLGGACACGAVFLFDESGSHGGEAIVEVMILGCGDWDTAWSLEPDVDYRQITLSYDPLAHRTSSPGDAYEPEGKLYFFKRLDRDGKTDPPQDPTPA